MSWPSLPPQRTDPWYAPFSTAWAEVKTYVDNQSFREAAPTTFGLAASAEPTIAAWSAANAASSIASAVGLPYDDARVRIFGGVTRLRNTSGIYSFENGNVGSSGNPPLMVEFFFDGSEFEFGIFGAVAGADSGVLLRVNGEYLNAGVLASPGATGAKHWRKVTFATRQVRHITIETASLGWCGLNVGPNDTVWRPSGNRKTVAFLGDSFTDGSVAHPLKAWWATSSALLGWDDPRAFGQGGTGYVNPGPAYPDWGVFSGRVARIAAQSPEIVVVAGGINDTAYAPTAIQSAAESLYAQIKAALPSCQLVVLNSWYTIEPPYAPFDAVNGAIAAAVAASPHVDVYLDPKGWMTGTGKVGATTGSGNADLYRSADGTHPTQEGHNFLGQRFADAYVASRLAVL